MWKSLFSAVGIFAMLFGAECLGVEKMILKSREAPPPKTSLWDSAPKMGANKEFVPPTWIPWSLISSGAVTCLYSVTLPKRMGK